MGIGGCEHLSPAARRGGGGGAPLDRSSISWIEQVACGRLHSSLSRSQPRSVAFPPSAASAENPKPRGNSSPLQRKCRSDRPLQSPIAVSCCSREAGQRKLAGSSGDSGSGAATEAAAATSATLCPSACEGCRSFSCCCRLFSRSAFCASRHQSRHAPPPSDARTAQTSAD